MFDHCLEQKEYRIVQIKLFSNNCLKVFFFQNGRQNFKILPFYNDIKKKSQWECFNKYGI